MRRFEILEPKSIAEGCKILAAEEDVKLIAGGTALLILIKQGIFVPKTLINLKKIKHAGEIKLPTTPTTVCVSAVSRAFTTLKAPRSCVNTTRCWPRSVVSKALDARFSSRRSGMLSQRSQNRIAVSKRQREMAFVGYEMGDAARY